MVNRWFGVGQFLSGAMGQLYPGGDNNEILNFYEFPYAASILHPQPPVKKGVI